MPESQYSFQFPESAYRDLAALATHASALPQLKDAISSLSAADSRQEAVSRVAASTGLSEEDAGRVLGALVNLHSLLTRTEEDPRHLVEMLTTSLEAKAPEGWKRDNLPKWIGAKVAIADALNYLLPDSPLAIVNKAKRVERSHENAFLGATIYTTLRPVFSEDASSIHRMVVFSELILTYMHNGSPTELQLALDAEDILELKRQCERAQLKSATVKKSLADCNWSTFVLSDTDNAD